MLSNWEVALGIVGMGLITLLTRAFFMLPKEELPMPDWAKQGLRYAPLAALAAVIVPEIVMSQGQLIDTWRDARLYATAVASAYFFWRRDILGTILSGTAVMLALRIGLGW
ncbi:MAG: AzlD domain-containing protein [Burkholderiaceae bacterium]|uniref:AzlD domain-containing protein n=1 Tax=Paucibacter sp. KCTC 42545 TaxID=1768242 RepID=UPI000733C043|nr:AzlD domain-containing protein [Paucibacter sp. KCTC 42545]ALT75877.1 branched-chain amino acid transporter [Paucibacter sp. KCTC 42545]MBY0234754.1 AzlD domain-containing protein [Burkholderiaceae bacterium]